MERNNPTADPNISKYSFANIKESAHSEFSSLYPKSDFKIALLSPFYYLVNKDHVKKNYSGIKVHLNLADSKQLEKAWDFIAPILVSELGLTKLTKIINVEKSRAMDEARVKQIETLMESAQKIPDEKERNARIKDIQDAREYCVKEMERRINATQITDYLYKDKDGIVDIAGYKKLFEKINQVLKDAKDENNQKLFTPAVAPDSDFIVNDFISLRGDHDQNGREIVANDIFKVDIWRYFQNHHVVTQLVNEENRKKLPAEFSAMPLLLREKKHLQGNTELISGITNLMQTIISSLNKEAKSPYVEALQKMQERLNFKMTPAIDNLLAILGVTEETLNQVEAKKMGSQKGMTMFAAPPPEDPCFTFLKTTLAIGSDRPALILEKLQKFQKTLPEIVSSPTLTDEKVSTSPSQSRS